MPALPHDITQLLRNWSQGDKAALDQIVSIVYPELRRLAERHMYREDPAHTLQTSALINEAYLKLVEESGNPLDGCRFKAWECRMTHGCQQDVAASAKRDLGRKHPIRRALPASEKPGV